jgi:hypothetical protein
MFFPVLPGFEPGISLSDRQEKSLTLKSGLGVSEECARIPAESGVRIDIELQLTAGGDCRKAGAIEWTQLNTS